MAASQPLFVALKTFWEANYATTLGYFTDQAGLVRVFQEDPPANTPRPYLVLVITGEAPELFTNQSQYDGGTFETKVAADNPEDEVDSAGRVTFPGAGESLLAAVETMTKAAAGRLTLPNGLTMKKLRPGAARYEESNHLWLATREWAWTAGGPK